MAYHDDPRNTPELLSALASHGLPTDSPSQLSDAFRVAWWAQAATIARLTAERDNMWQANLRLQRDRDRALSLLPRAYEAGRDDAAERASHYMLATKLFDAPKQAYTISCNIRAIPVPSPADLAARLGGAE